MLSIWLGVIVRNYLELHCRSKTLKVYETNLFDWRTSLSLKAEECDTLIALFHHRCIYWSIPLARAVIQLNQFTLKRHLIDTSIKLHTCKVFHILCLYTGGVSNGLQNVACWSAIICWGNCWLIPYCWRFKWWTWKNEQNKLKTIWTALAWTWKKRDSGIIRMKNEQFWWFQVKCRENIQWNHQIHWIDHFGLLVQCI